MSAVNRLDIEQSWTRLTAVLDKFGAGDGWQLIPGGQDGDRRTAWSVTDQDGRTILVLGYTQRDVLSALANQCAILAAILGA